MREHLQSNIEEEESEINITPMLDVVFIMLIFFIVTATFVKEAGIEVNRPDAATASIHPIMLNKIQRLARCMCRRNIHHCGTVRDSPYMASAVPNLHFQLKPQSMKGEAMKGEACCPRG